MKDKWQIEIDSISVSVSGKETNVCTKCQAILNVGVRYIFGPTDIVNSMMKAFTGVESINGEYVVDCSRALSLPVLVFQIKGVRMSIGPTEYVSKDRKSCILFIAGGYENWIIGDPFLFNYYSIYDMSKNRIGLAFAKK